MGNHLVHGDTTSEEIFREEFVEGPESERSPLPEFPDTMICNEVFTGYLRKKKKKKNGGEGSAEAGYTWLDICP